MRRLGITVLVAAGLLGAAGFGGWRWWVQAVNQAGPLQEARAVVIPHGSIGQLAQVLASDGIITQPELFRATAWISRHDGALRAAEFMFPAHASLAQVLAVLRTAHPVEHHLTIAEGLTAKQITALLSRADAMTGPVPVIAEGSVLPQTYDYEYGAERSRLVGRAQAAMAKGLAAAWADRAPGLPLATAQDALILASIVERETAKPQERSHVAAVYLNRLRLGMRLQADPTVVYAASDGLGTLDHGLTRSELDRSDPYNTYRVHGLPPSPICSPGLDSIRAVLHPDNSDDLYFVADGSGGHVFSHSYEAHGAAVARWRALNPSSSHGNPD